MKIESWEKEKINEIDLPKIEAGAKSKGNFGIEGWKEIERARGNTMEKKERKGNGQSFHPEAIGCVCSRIVCFFSPPFILMFSSPLYLWLFGLIFVQEPYQMQQEREREREKEEQREEKRKKALLCKILPEFPIFCSAPLALIKNLWSPSYKLTLTSTQLAKLQPAKCYYTNK